MPVNEGPEPILVDVPHRRTSVTRPGGGSMVGLQPSASSLHQEANGWGEGEGELGMPPKSPELRKQTSEEQLLDTAFNIGLVR